ncbi:response regulator [Lyngbya aestuarii]|uniref:response regulator n=1 Tax=Lyngbya aestuarii TaxID=118322 RepID=UPI00403DE338
MNKPVILCVDDEVMILDCLKRQLKTEFRNTYVYELAENADEAMILIEELEKNKSEILVIISDWLMPGIKGDEFLIGVHQKFPDIIKILLTGQADEKAIRRANTQANMYCHLCKPWSATELIETIKSGLKTISKS